MKLGAVSVPQGLAAAYPKARREGGSLHWNLSEYKQVDPSGMLDQFIRIADDDDVERFARRFGVLYLCKHEWPVTHVGVDVLRLTKPSVDCSPDGWPDDIAEPIARWLTFAKQASAVIRLASYLVNGERLRPADRAELWRTLNPVAKPNAIDAFVNKRGLAIWNLTEYVNGWLAIGNARPALVWQAWNEKSVPSFEVRAGGASAFGLIAVQLATAVARGHEIYICDGCSMAYPRTERPPQPGRMNYCLTCKHDGIDERDRKRRQRETPGGGHGGKKGTR